MAWADFAAQFFSDIAQQRHEEAAAQARQQRADRFADAWTRGAISIPSQLVWTVACPDGTTVPVWPRCTATITDTGMLLTFTVPLDGVVTAEQVAQQADAIRFAARAFFGVRLRVTGVEATVGRCSIALTPVVPSLDERQNFLAGFNDRGMAVWLPLLGQVTAVAGDDGAVSWISACISDAIPTTTAEPAAVVADARRAGFAAKKSGEPPVPLIVGLEDAQPGADQLRAELLGFARRGLVEWSTAPQVETSAWAVRPTQVIMRSGEHYVVDQNGRKTPFFPAWRF